MGVTVVTNQHGYLRFRISGRAAISLYPCVTATTARKAADRLGHLFDVSVSYALGLEMSAAICALAAALT